MITQSYLNDEIDLAKRIFIFYTDKMLSYLQTNSSKYDQWYRDSLQLEYLIGVLEAIELIDGEIRLGYLDKTDNIALATFYKVREYYLSEVDDDYLTTPIGDIVIPEKSTYLPYGPDWKEIAVNITSNNTTAFVLPFTYANIDPESMSVTVEGYGAIYQTESGEGFHITNNTFYWHHYFNLDSGAKVHFRYKQILM